MLSRRVARAALVAVLALGACGFAEEELWPSLSGEEPSGGESVAIAPSEGELQGTPTIGSATVAPSSVTPYTAAVGSTGTAVGAKIAAMTGELWWLKQAIERNAGTLRGVAAESEAKAQRYYATFAAITARLQVGTTPGNPVLVSQWNTAQSELDGIAVDIGRLNSIANTVAADAGMTSYLQDSIRATYRLSGAIDEDHRQLRALEDEVDRTIVAIDRLLGDANSSIARQTAYVNTERRNLSQLALAVSSGQVYGPALSGSTGAVGTSGLATASGAAFGGSPLVVIRFDRPDVPYRQALYAAVSQALDRQPAAMFDLVAVAPNRGTPSEVALAADSSRRYAEDVLRSLNDMGLPSNRITLSSLTSPDIAANEVRVFVRERDSRALARSGAIGVASPDLDLREAAMRRTRAVVVLALVVLALVFGAPAAWADGLPEADRGAIRAVIEAQLQAFRDDDGPRAYGFAAPGIQRIFPTHQVFMAMVRTGYPAVYRAAETEFRDIEPLADGRWRQHVLIVGADGEVVLALYTMERQTDGTWKIAGCRLVATNEAVT
ncbi:MAG: DUF4864 domain-containing protein [Alphaproteobacteria bacterium]